MRHSLSHDTRTYLPVETRSQTIPEPYDARSCLDYTIRVTTVDGRDGTVSCQIIDIAGSYFNRHKTDFRCNFPSSIFQKKEKEYLVLSKGKYNF